MNRLVNISQGLSPAAIRQLYIACVTSVADYGSILWYKDTISEAKLAPLQAIQNLALRKVLGVFKIAPIKPIEVEGAIVPPKIRLSHYIRRYALRLLKLSETYLVNTKLAQIRDSKFPFNYLSNTSAIESRLKKNSKKAL